MNRNRKPTRDCNPLALAGAANPHKAFLDTLAGWPEPVAPSAEEKACLIETLMEIDRLLDGLPTVVKRAFLHAQLDGMSQPEIAAELGISLSSVRRYLIKASAQCYFALALD